MAKTLGYMITFTTFGTWLQGDRRGYVKDGKIHPKNKNLEQANMQSQSQDAVLLTTNQQITARKAILDEAAAQHQRILALAINSNHVHIVAENTSKPINEMVAYYKKAVRLALKATGHSGKLWTKGYDKRFCFDKTTLAQKVKYVQNHNTHNI